MSALKHCLTLSDDMPLKRCPMTPPVEFPLSHATQDIHVFLAAVCESAAAQSETLMGT